jgi:hypothetical protein
MYLEKEQEYLKRIRFLEDENARLEMELDEANYTLQNRMGEITL